MQPMRRGQLFAQGLTRGQTRIRHGLGSRSNAVVDEGVHGARFFGAHVGLQIKALDLARNFAGESGGIKLGDQADAGLTGQHIGPGSCHRVTHGTDTTQTCNDDTTTRHVHRSQWFVRMKPYL